MWNNLPYLIEVQICFSLAWLLYRTALSRDNAFARNRAYLLLAVPLSFVVPQLSIPVFLGVEVAAIQGFTDIVTEDVETLRVETFDWGRFVWWGYLAGVLLMTGLLGVNVVRMWRKTRRLESVRIRDTRICYVEHMGTAFSFFNRIYLDRTNISKDELQQVITHELCHVRLRHSWDMVFAQGMRILFWWSPFVWLWIRSLKEIHEYQADAAVLENGFNSEKYFSLILHHLTGIHPEFVSGFSYSLIKKRLIMIAKEKPKRVAKLKVLLPLPLIGVMLLLFSFTERAPRIIPSTNAPDDEMSFSFALKEGENSVEISNNGVAVESSGEKSDNAKFTISANGVSLTAGKIGVNKNGVDIRIDNDGGKVATEFIDKLTRENASGQNNISADTRIFVDGKASDLANLRKLNAQTIASISISGNSGTDAGEIRVKTKSAPDAPKPATNPTVSGDEKPVNFISDQIQLIAGKDASMKEFTIYVDGVEYSLADLAKTKFTESDINSMSIDKRKKKIWFSTKAGTDKTEIQPAHMPVFQKEGLPEFQRYVQEHLRYPSALAEKRIGGRVVVSFAVEKDGSVGQITVVQTPSKDLAAVVVRAVESAPKWAKPGLDAENNPVAVKYHLPVDFAIQ